ncbi:hypothetical protein HNR46_004244 [Haloferula luteola]|uniref:Uncharacterized protein n=1 Tax=Haloferula luteola TaxID=595692 RepID=A0A840V8C2_9BACT|nr:hypothetical protein [Haloferula luteola]MBB5353973.1 hypothetical protein [Haloferula luteola]
MRKIKLIAFLLAVFASLAAPAAAQQNSSRCVSKITDALERLGQQNEFDFLKAREIMNDFHYGTVQAAVSDPAKATAFKRVFTSLSQFCDLGGANLSAKGMRGYTKLTSGIINVGKDNTDILIEVFRGKNAFDAAGFDKVMTHMDGNGQWLKKNGKYTGRWESPAGLIYVENLSVANQGHSLMHLYKHTVRNFGGRPDADHSVFSVPREDLLDLIDEAWQNPNKVHPPKPDGSGPDLQAYVVDMGRVVGTNSETTIRIVLNNIGTDELRTAYPQ